MSRFLVLLLLAGCVSDERELIVDSDQCYDRGQRAVMLCDGRHCLIECRDKRVEEKR